MEIDVNFWQLLVLILIFWFGLSVAISMYWSGRRSVEKMYVKEELIKTGMTAQQAEEFLS